MGSAFSHGGSTSFLGCEFSKHIIRCDEQTARSHIATAYATFLLKDGFCVVAATTPATNNVDLVTFSFPMKLALVPGGHVRIKGARVSRSYTPYHIDDTSFTVAVKRYPNGQVSNFVHGQKVGDKLKITGPEEPVFSVVDKQFDCLWLVSGGTGIAPIYSMAKHCVENNSCKQLVVFACFRDADDSLIDDELVRLVNSTHDGRSRVTFRLVFIFSRMTADGTHKGAPMMCGRFNVNQVKQFPAPSQVVVCGPPGFDTTICEALSKINVPDTMIEIM